ncbi:MAG: hypothetical protein WBA73_03560 [Devosia sp.]|jgi:hypothetical protein
MHIKSIVSAVALSAALGFSGGAVYAQDAALPTMIGEQQLTPEDAERVKVHCEDLQTAENQAEGTESTDVDAPASEEAGGAAETAAVGSVDMDLITVEACLEAGFVTAP